MRRLIQRSCWAPGAAGRTPPGARYALYLLDWDSTTRSERIDIVDAATGAVLNSQTTSSFNGGKYLVWNVSGHVQIQITRLTGANAVLSGLFFA